jgi:hypothetical protein
MCGLCKNGEHKVAHKLGAEWGKQNGYPTSKPVAGFNKKKG